MARHTERDDHPFEDRRGPSTRRRRRRWPWLLLVALLVAVLFLPNLIGMTSLKQKAIDYALADFNGRISVENASLGWLQSVELTNVQATAADGQPLLRIDRVKTSGSLLSFLTSSNYGQIDVEGPAVWLQVREGGSNLEDACAAWLQADDANLENTAAQPASAWLPNLQLNLIKGVVTVSTEDTNKTWQLEDLNFHASTTDEAAAVVADLACRVTPSHTDSGHSEVAEGRGTLTVAAQVDPASDTLSANVINATIESNQLPLSVVGPLLHRLIGNADTGGTLTAQLHAAYDATAQEVQLEVKLAEMQNASIFAPSLLGSDQVRITSLQSAGNLTLSPSLIHANQFQIASDFANASANGTLDVGQLNRLASAQSASSDVLLITPFQMDGQLDLAGFAAVMPATLQLKEGLEIQSGVVNFQVGSRIENDLRRLIVNVDTANLVAVDQGRPIIWQKPLRLVATVRQDAQSLMLEEVRCESDFLTVSGQANMETGSFVAQGDLDQLVQRVGQFIDLGGTELSGEIDGKLAWQSVATANAQVSGQAAQPVQLVGEFHVDHPAFKMPGIARWSRPNLTARVSAAGQSTSGQQLQIDEGGLQIDIGTEQAIFTLAEPVANALSNPRWHLNSQLSGSAAGWLAHVQNFVDLGDVQTNGQLQAQAVTIVDNLAIELHDLKYDVQQLQFEGYGVTVREQKTSGTGSARYDLQTGQLILADAMLSSDSISLGGQRIAIDMADNMQINGNVAFRADVNRLADWLALSPTDDSVFWFGSSEGTIEFKSDRNGIGARVQSSVNDMVAATRQPGQPGGARAGQAETTSPMRSVSNATPWAELWREAKVGVNGDLTMANDFNAIAFENASIESATLGATVTGQITDLANTMVADLSGQWTPDWGKLNALLAAYSGNTVQMAGQGSHPISLRGPLFATARPGQPSAWVSPLLTAASRFDWQRAAVAGLPIGAGSMQINLDQGIATINTNDIAFSNGVIRLRPQIDLRSAEPVLYLPKGTLIDNVALTPETARQWLKFVAPLAADATSAQGQFTLATEGAKVPLLDPLTMHAQGTLTLSNVVIGAGPTAEKLLATVKQLRSLIDPEGAASDRDRSTWLQIEEQAVPVAVQNGRVFHEGMKISHKDIIVRTSGSVGLDQTLDLVAEIPIADDWIEGKQHLASLKGQTLSIPIRGTASKPQIDQRALTQFSQKLVGQAASDAINKLVGEKVAPKLGEYQQKVTGRVNEEVGKLQNKLQDKLQEQAGEMFKTQAKEAAKGELLKGIGNLFGK